MRILITGADGFVGRHLSAALANSGFKLTLGVRRDEGQLKVSGNVKIVSVGDVGPDTDWTQALKGVDCVINLVGRNHVLHEYVSTPREAFWNTNCHGVSRLYYMAQLAGVSKFLHLSSVHVCGTDTPKGNWFDDASPAHPMGHYAVSKHEGEQALLRLSKGNSTSLVMLRAPLIVGAGAKGNLDKLVRLVVKPVPIPVKSISNRRSLLSIENLVTAVLAVLEKWQYSAHSGTYLVADDEVVSTYEIARAIKIGVKGKAWLMPMRPSWLKKALSFAGKRKTALQLTGSLEVNSTGFCHVFNWRPVVKTQDSLVGMGRHHFKK